MMNKDMNEKIDIFSRLLDQADCILVGAGSGLLADAGIDYYNTAFFIEKYPAMVQYGFTTNAELMGRRSEEKPTPAARFTPIFLKMPPAIRPSVFSVYPKAGGKFLTLILRWKSAATRCCAHVLPLAGKISMQPVPAFIRNGALPAGNALRPAHSKQLFLVNLMRWTVPGAMNATVVSKSVPKMPFRF